VSLAEERQVGTYSSVWCNGAEVAVQTNEGNDSGKVKLKHLEEMYMNSFPTLG
jgi:hypothetical protein